MKTKTSLSKNWSKVKTFFKNIFSNSKETISELKKEIFNSEDSQTNKAFKPKFKPKTGRDGENPVWSGKTQRKKKSNRVRLSRNTRRKHRKAV